MLNLEQSPVLTRMTILYGHQNRSWVPYDDGQVAVYHWPVVGPKLVFAIARITKPFILSAPLTSFKIDWLRPPSMMNSLVSASLIKFYAIPNYPDTGAILCERADYMGERLSLILFLHASRFACWHVPFQQQPRFNSYLWESNAKAGLIPLNYPRYLQCELDFNSASLENCRVRINSAK